MASQSSGKETTQVVTTSNVDVTDPPVDDEPKYCFKCSASIGLDFIREEGLPCFTPDDETKTIESQGCCYTRYGVVEGHPDKLQYVQRGTDDCSELEEVCEDMPLNEIDDVSRVKAVNHIEKIEYFFQGDHENDEEINICEYVCESVIDGNLCNTNFTTDRPTDGSGSSRTIGGPFCLILGLLIGFQ